MYREKSNGGIAPEYSTSKGVRQALSVTNRVIGLAKNIKLPIQFYALRRFILYNRLFHFILGIDRLRQLRDLVKPNAN